MSDVELDYEERNMREIYLSHCKKTIASPNYDLASVPKIVQELPSCPCKNKKPYVKICEICMVKILEWRLLHFEKIMEDRIKRVQNIDKQTIDIAEGRVREYKKETRKIEIKFNALKADGERKGRFIKKMWGDLIYLNNVLRENGLSEYCSEIEKTWRPEDDDMSYLDSRVTAQGSSYKQKEKSATVVNTSTAEVIERVKVDVIRDAVKDIVEPVSKVLVEKIAAIDRQITDAREEMLLVKDGLNDHTSDQMKKMAENTVTEVALLTRYQDVSNWPIGRRSRMTPSTPAFFRGRLQAYHDAMKDGTLTRETAIAKGAKWVTYRNEDTDEFLGTIIEFDNNSFQKQVLQRGRKVEVAPKSKNDSIVIDGMKPTTEPVPSTSKAASIAETESGELVTRNTRYRRSTQSRASSPENSDDNEEFHNAQSVATPRTRKSSVRLTGRSNLPLELSSITKRLKKTVQHDDDDTSLDSDLFTNDGTGVNITNDVDMDTVENTTDFNAAGEPSSLDNQNSDTGASVSNVAVPNADSPDASPKRLVIAEDADTVNEDEENSDDDFEQDTQGSPNPGYYLVN